MSAGLQPTLTDVNNTVGNQLRTLNTLLTQLHQLRTWYLSLGAGGLTNVPYSMSAADDANVGSALADAEQLYQIYVGNQALATAKSFHTFADRLTGFGY